MSPPEDSLFQLGLDALFEQGGQLSFGPALKGRVLPALIAAAEAGDRAEVEGLVRLNIALESQPGGQSAAAALWALLSGCAPVCRLYATGLDARRARMASKMLGEPGGASRLGAQGPAPAGSMRAGLFMVDQAIQRNKKR